MYTRHTSISINIFVVFVFVCFFSLSSSIIILFYSQWNNNVNRQRSNKEQQKKKKIIHAYIHTEYSTEFSFLTKKLWKKHSFKYLQKQHLNEGKRKMIDSFFIHKTHVNLFTAEEKKQNIFLTERRLWKCHTQQQRWLRFAVSCFLSN